MRLDRNAWRGHRPRLAQSIDDGAGIEAPAGCLEESERCLEDIFSGRPAKSGQIGGDCTVLCSMARVKGLRHRSKVVAQTAALCGRNPQRVDCLLTTESRELRARGGAPK